MKKATFNRIIFLALIFSSIFSIDAHSQKTQYLPGIIFQGDTIPMKVLPIVTIEAPMSRKLKRMLEHNRKLIENVKKVMPYAKTCAYRLKIIDQQMMGITDENKRKEFYDEQEALLREEFEGELRKLTISQGKLLVKLIDRESGRTTFTLIQNYRSGVTAVFWQGIGRVFGYNLKEEYDPEKEKDLEMIIKMLGYE
jgi:hypothetical protein